ncbi:ARF GAP-like zinc finger-containing protein ZiGA4 [Striga asiatica]|uniref:ARF GAP-like zinc finger-containing protein ZiGA4 n=1 Tax=Striga asiatica TaxID=4170 RepID=A0A5A7NZS8_STRAF|nr:ARF GAP-like zinc finger-containing protein ZiGA4 [Striga asiatica]
MSSKREEEKNEKIIRGLMKLPPNRRCINCNSLGPQYVCTNFWTFVCLICSGIHREFTHRVKSVSMAKFTSQEVDALQKGGNQRARELFLKSWDPQKQRLPDNSNVDKVREFIKNVYVENRYATEKSSSRPPRDSQNHGDETRRASSYHSYSQSPPYDFQYEERRYGKNAPALTRKPGSDRAVYEGKFSSFLSPSRLSGANEGSYPRVSDYSVSSGGDPFRPDVPSPQREIGSPSSDTSSHFSHTGIHNPDGNNINNGGRVHHHAQCYQIAVMVVRRGGFLRYHHEKFVKDAGYGGATCCHGRRWLCPLLKLSTRAFTLTCNFPHLEHRTTSSGSFGSFDSMSFKSVNSVGLQEVVSEPEQSLDMFHNKTPSFPSPQNSIPTTFNGLDLFSEPFAPQNVTSAPKTHIPDQSLASPVDLFQKSPSPSVATFGELQNLTALPKQQSVAHFKGENSEMVMPDNGGWATFDVPQSSLPVGTDNTIPSLEPSPGGNKHGVVNPFSLDQSYLNHNSAYHEPSASMHAVRHDGLKNVETARNSAPVQLWNAFEEFPGQQTIDDVPKNSNRAAVPHVSDANESRGLGVNKALGGNVRTPNEVGPPSSSLSSHFGMPVHNISTVPIVTGAHSLATGLKPTNPFDFDLPCDAALESSSMNQFWDMSSLQAALPDNHIPDPHVSGPNGSWFPQNSLASYAPSGTTFDPPRGSFEFIVEQVPNTRMSTVSQGPFAAPIGGNPFA